MRKLFFIHPPSPARMPFTGAAAVRLQSGFFRGIIINTKSTILRKTPSPLLARALPPWGVTRDHACRKRGLPVKNDKIHSSLLTLVGGYLLYIAYHLLENMRKGSADMSRALFTVLIAAFAGVGIGVLFYAWKIWRRSRADEGDDRPEDRDPR